MPRTRMEIRKARHEHAGAIAELWRDGHEGLVPPALVAARTEESFRTRAHDRIAEMSVAVVDGAIAGFILVVGDELEQLYVAAPPAARESRTRSCARLSDSSSLTVIRKAGSP
jgi:hypothetical protein